MENTDVKKPRGRPIGSIDPKTLEERKKYCIRQLEKLFDRMKRLSIEVDLVKEKISDFQKEVS